MADENEIPAEVEGGQGAPQGRYEIVNEVNNLRGAQVAHIMSGVQAGIAAHLLPVGEEHAQTIGERTNGTELPSDVRPTPRNMRATEQSWKRMTDLMQPAATYTAHVENLAAAGGKLSQFILNNFPGEGYDSIPGQTVYAPDLRDSARQQADAIVAEMRDGVYDEMVAVSASNNQPLLNTFLYIRDDAIPGAVVDMPQAAEEGLQEESLLYLNARATQHLLDRAIEHDRQRGLDGKQRRVGVGRMSVGVPRTRHSMGADQVVTDVDALQPVQMADGTTQWFLNQEWVTAELGRMNAGHDERFNRMCADASQLMVNRLQLLAQFYEEQVKGELNAARIGGLPGVSVSSVYMDSARPNRQPQGDDNYLESLDHIAFVYPGGNAVDREVYVGVDVTFGTGRDGDTTLADAHRETIQRWKQNTLGGMNQVTTQMGANSRGLDRADLVVELQADPARVQALLNGMGLQVAPMAQIRQMREQQVALAQTNAVEAAAMATQLEADAQARARAEELFWQQFDRIAGLDFTDLGQPAPDLHGERDPAAVLGTYLSLRANQIVPYNREIITGENGDIPMRSVGFDALTRNLGQLLYRDTADATARDRALDGLRTWDMYQGRSPDLTTRDTYLDANQYTAAHYTRAIRQFIGQPQPDETRETAYRQNLRTWVNEYVASHDGAYPSLEELQEQVMAGVRGQVQAIERGVREEVERINSAEHRRGRNVQPVTVAQNVNGITTERVSRQGLVGDLHMDREPGERAVPLTEQTIGIWQDPDLRFARIPHDAVANGVQRPEGSVWITQDELLTQYRALMEVGRHRAGELQLLADIGRAIRAQGELSDGSVQFSWNDMAQWALGNVPNATEDRLEALRERIGIDPAVTLQNREALRCLDRAQNAINRELRWLEPDALAHTVNHDWMGLGIPAHNPGDFLQVNTEALERRLSGLRTALTRESIEPRYTDRELGPVGELRTQLEMLYWENGDRFNPDPQHGPGTRPVAEGLALEIMNLPSLVKLAAHAHGNAQARGTIAQVFDPAQIAAQLEQLAPGGYEPGFKADTLVALLDQHCAAVFGNGPEDAYLQLTDAFYGDVARLVERQREMELMNRRHAGEEVEIRMIRPVAEVMDYIGNVAQRDLHVMQTHMAINNIHRVILEDEAFGAWLEDRNIGGNRPLTAYLGDAQAAWAATIVEDMKAAGFDFTPVQTAVQQVEERAEKAVEEKKTRKPRQTKAQKEAAAAGASTDLDPADDAEVSPKPRRTRKKDQTVQADGEKKETGGKKRGGKKEGANTKPRGGRRGAGADHDPADEGLTAADILRAFVADGEVVDADGVSMGFGVIPPSSIPEADSLADTQPNQGTQPLNGKGSHSSRVQPRQRRTAPRDPLQPDGTGFNLGGPPGN